MQQEIRLVSITPDELAKMLESASEKAIQKMKELQSAPSEYEELTLEEAAAELHCSIRTIRRRMVELNIKGYKVGKIITVQRKDLKKIRKAS